MRPSSSASDPAPGGSGLFDALSRRGSVPELVGDTAYLRAMLDTEAALARAEARAGVIPAEHAAAITEACAAGRFGIAEIGRAAEAPGNPVEPLVRRLRDVVGGAAADYVHAGATSQDILDTATMLVARQALVAVVADIDAAGDAAARLAADHRHTLMAGRTLLQQALPITFGAKAAGWLSGLDDAAELLDSVRDGRLGVQLGGGAGTLASLHPHGPQVVALLAEELGLPAPALPWHTNRTRIAALAGALGVAATAMAKPARDVTLLAQTEVGEVREAAPGRGRSSTMPHKRNPVAAVATLANTAQAPGLVATVLTAAAGHEHERAAGAWHAEWHPLRELFLAVGSAAAWLADCLAHLEVDAARMRANLDLRGGAGTAVGEQVRAAPPLAGVDLGRGEPEDYLGATGEFITAALRRHAARRNASP
jgi:3-carboxy-cis,cis-muconate cycloisomerase